MSQQPTMLEAHRGMVQRFEQRCFQPPSCQLSVQSVIPHPDPTKVTAFYASAQGRPILELYHSLREQGKRGVRIVDAMFQHGLRSGSACNKGYGVYLANHGRYAANWGGDLVMVCHVIYEPGRLERFRSEIFSPSSECCSEFVLNPCATNLLLPIACLVTDKFERSRVRDEMNDMEVFQGFVPRGMFGCPECDAFKLTDSHGNVFHTGRRCDCQQLPTLLESDCIPAPTTI